jgi:hypothetical protein
VSWFNAQSPQPEQQAKPRLASQDDIETTFEEEYENLFWIGLLITGNATTSIESITHASGLSFASGVFKDWLVRWANSITARVAIDIAHEPIAGVASRYAEWSCAHREHDVFSNEEAQWFRQADPNEIIAALDPLARSVAVVRGVQKSSASECASLLGLSRRCIIGAYCHALQWIRQRRSAITITVPEAISQNDRSNWLT